MLLIAAHVLGDIDRWWRQHGSNLGDDVQQGDLYRLLHQTAVEAEAAWSLLSQRSDGSRTFTAVSVLPITLRLVESGSSLIVWDVRIHPDF